MKANSLYFRWTLKTIWGSVNHGSLRLKLNELARELFLFGLEHNITLNVE